jgi:hypothetical protein
VRAALTGNDAHRLLAFGKRRSDGCGCIFMTIGSNAFRVRQPFSLCGAGGPSRALTTTAASRRS